MKILVANATPFESITKEGRVLIPLNVTFEPHRFPLSLCLVAAAIREANPGAHVEVSDGPAAGLSLDALRRQIRAAPPALLLLNIASPTLESDLGAARAAHELGARVAAFGQHAQALPEELLREPEIDYCLTADPEPSAATLVGALRKGGGLREVRGIAYHDSGGRLQRQEAPEAGPPLSALPRPARDLVDSRRYRLPDGERYTLVLAGRGCPWDCSFCLAPAMHGRRARRREIDDLLDEVRGIVSGEGIRSILFQADLFTVNRNWVVELCEALIAARLGIRWICNTRIDTLDRELLELMRRAGLFLISFGLESGDQQMLARLGKPRVQPVDIRRTVAACQSLGIRTNGSFVVGHPGESWESLARTRELILSLPLDMAVLMCATPHPGTPLYARLAAGAGFLSEDFRDFSFNRYVVGGTDLSAEEIATYIRDLRRAFYWNPRYLRRRLGDLREPLRALRTALFLVQRLLVSRRAFRRPDSLEAAPTSLASAWRVPQRSELRETGS